MYIIELSEQDDEGRTTLTIKHNGRTLCEFRDGFEPEDGYFYRDLAWVPDELENAYKLGIDYGKKSKP